jgi:hypothetical protein
MKTISRTDGHARRRLALLGVLALALSVTAGLAVGDASAAKKKKKKGKAGGTVDITKVVSAPIPDATASIDGVLASTIDVAGKQFKGTKVRDVNVSVSTTGSTAAGPGSANHLAARLTAPNGATTWLFGAGFTLSGQSILGLTLDDETPNRLTPNPPRDATEVGPPYFGTAQPDPFTSFGNVSFSAMDNGPASGTWTLRFYDIAAGPPVATSIFNSWRLVVIAGKPFKTK